MSPALLRLVAGLAVLGAAGCIVGAILDWAAFARAWLAATVTLGLLPLGALPALLAFGLTGGAWGRLSRPAWQALLALMPVFALAFVPLVFALDQLFPWTQPPEQLPEVVRHKLLYLNVPFLLARLGLYLAIWLGFTAACLRRMPGMGACAAGVILWLFSLTFFGFDWLLSLEPKFYTDVFGLWLAVTTLIAAGAAVLLLLPADAPDQARADLANLWLACLLGWALMGFSQYIIIWSGNLPLEIGWHLARGEGVWRAIGWLQFFLIFALPFAILLSTRAKHRRGPLRLAAASALAGCLLLVQWWVLPAFKPLPLTMLWLSPAALAALAALALLLVGGRLQRTHA